MKRLFIALLVLLPVRTGFCTNWVITNSGFTFNPATITITVGDDVTFTLAGIHNAVEVSQSTWDVNGNTALPGGFQTSFGGGLVPASQLAIGIHYFVCFPHASMQMKGMIIVQNITDIIDKNEDTDLSVYPNPANNTITIKNSSNLIGQDYNITTQSGSSLLKVKSPDAITSIDISHLNPGIYLLQISGKKRQSVKIIKN